MKLQCHERRRIVAVAIGASRERRCQVVDMKSIHFHCMVLGVLLFAGCDQQEGRLAAQPGKALLLVEARRGFKTKLTGRESGAGAVLRDEGPVTKVAFTEQE